MLRIVHLIPPRYTPITQAIRLPMASVAHGGAGPGVSGGEAWVVVGVAAEAVDGGSDK